MRGERGDSRASTRSIAKRVEVDREHCEDLRASPHVRRQPIDERTRFAECPVERQQECRLIQPLHVRWLERQQAAIHGDCLRPRIRLRGRALLIQPAEVGVGRRRAWCQPDGREKMCFGVGKRAALRVHHARQVVQGRIARIALESRIDDRLRRVELLLLQERGNALDRRVRGTIGSRRVRSALCGNGRARAEQDRQDQTSPDAHHRRPADPCSVNCWKVARAAVGVRRPPLATVDAGQRVVRGRVGRIGFGRAPRAPRSRRRCVPSARGALRAGSARPRGRLRSRRPRGTAALPRGSRRVNEAGCRD